LELLTEQERDADVALIEECRSGDSSAFDAIVHRYKDRIYNVAYRFLGNHEDAQDVAQEVFVRAYRGIEGFKGDSKVYTWLYSIAGNLARNKLRDSKRKGRDMGVSLEELEGRAPGAIQSFATTRETPEDAARKQETSDALQDCLQELPEHYRIVFVLRTFEELSYEEIADSVGCPKGTVKSRLNHARKFLHEALKARSII